MKDKKRITTDMIKMDVFLYLQITFCCNTITCNVNYVIKVRIQNRFCRPNINCYLQLCQTKIQKLCIAS